MRLWSLHPKYLDPRGLVALWREALLARHVLYGRTVGYRHHPQLERFRACASPRAAIDAYLAAVHEEAVTRGYRFDASKFRKRKSAGKIAATRGQLEYEWGWLMAKLKRRSPMLHRKYLRVKSPQPHPLFRKRPGPIAPWERVSSRPARRSRSAARARAARRR